MSVRIASLKCCNYRFYSLGQNSLMTVVGIIMVLQYCPYLNSLTILIYYFKWQVEISSCDYIMEIKMISYLLLSRWIQSSRMSP